MEGFDTPEQAALDASFPAKFQRVLGVTIEGDRAVVYTLTNDRPPFEDYSDYCDRVHGRWVHTLGSSGWDTPPPEVVAAARALGHVP